MNDYKISEMKVVSSAVKPNNTNVLWLNNTDKKLYKFSNNGWEAISGSSFNVEKEYDTSKSYAPNTIVSYQGSSFMSLLSVPANEKPSIDSEYWTILAERGEQGPQGNSGYSGNIDELEVVNNLTDGGENSALSAEQGKRLKEWQDENITYINKVIDGSVVVDNTLSEVKADSPKPVASCAVANRIKYVTLSYWAWATYLTNNANAGDIVYNSSTKRIERKTTEGTLSEVAIIDGTVFEYRGNLFQWRDNTFWLLSTLIIPVIETDQGAEMLNKPIGSLIINRVDNCISMRTDDSVYRVNFKQNPIVLKDGNLYNLGDNAELLPISGIVNLASQVENNTSDIDKVKLDARSTKNIIDKSLTYGRALDVGTKTNCLINASTGAEVNYANATASEFIPINGGSMYMVSGSMALGWAVYALYDEEMKFISAYQAVNQSEATQLSNELITTPINASYIRVCQYFDNEDGAVREVEIVGKKWADKKWVCVGDSITEHNLRATKNYHDYIAESTGIQVVNMGRSGTGYKRTEDEGYAFYQRVESIPTDADVITIFGSGNDLNTSVIPASQLGTESDTSTDTIAGCINTTIDNIYSRLPLAVIGIVSPTPWIGAEPQDNNELWVNYVNLLKAICHRRGLPFLDLYYCSGLRPDDDAFRALVYSRDEGNGVHPNEVGHKLIAPRFEAFLATLIQ